MSEHDEQAALVKWFAMKFPELEPMLIAYPSGAIIGSATKSRAGAAAAKYGQIRKLKREGWKKGVPDLLLFVPRGEYHGLVIEMKDKGKTQCSLSDDQKQYLEDFAKQDYKSVWCAVFEAAKREILLYIN